ncbi:ParB/RepB/Spo0J family partition protein [Pseudonocardia sp. GCM10023141]|uniref:ParB/RepB/Spo0J family partition protein n=1 Tax=Pseudonocardia sp. GCM10023141 TaxID=3252653 RepID=UPI00361242C9
MMKWDAASRGLVVQFGQRRSLAPLQAGRESVPVFVVDQLSDVDRLTDQIIENDQRVDLSTAERVKGWEQLAAFGLAASVIAKRTGAKKAQVQTGLKVSASELAAKAAQRWDFLDLEQVAAVAEFEADPAAVKAIVAAAKSGQFDHAVQRLRDDRADAAAQEAVRVQLVEAGVAVIEREEMAWPMGRLDNHHLDAVEHASCPGHAAYVSTVWSSELQGQTFAAIYVCRDVVAHGHVDPKTANADGGARTPMSEQDKADRKVVIERNKQSASATTVRRDWLRGFVARKSAPVGAERFIATVQIASSACRRGHAIWRAIVRPACP